MKKPSYISHLFINTEKCYNYRKIQIFKRSPYTNDSISKQTIVGWCAYAKYFKIIFLMVYAILYIKLLIDILTLKPLLTSIPLHMLFLICFYSLRLTTIKPVILHFS